MKLINPGLFAIGILFFFLPFMEIRCNNQPLTEASGFALAFNLKMDVANENLAAYANKSPDMAQLNDKQRRPDVFSLSVLILMALALVLSLVPSMHRYWPAIIASSLSAIILILMQWLVKSKFDEQMSASGGEEFMQYIKISVHFGTGYWLVLFLNAGIALINIVLMRNARRDEVIVPYYPESSSDPTLDQEV
jgi:hypothetical protein